MQQPTIEIQGVDIVFVGSFNPQIFQPAWFVSEGLIRKEEGNTAQIRLLHPQVAAFSTDWFQLQVTSEKFFVSTPHFRSYEWLRDLALSTFQLLRYTPIKKMGLNRNFHFLMESEDKWHAVGHRLAPQEPWSGLLEEAGMRSLLMEGRRPDDFKGYIHVRAEPSTKAKPGVFISINDHYEVEDSEASQGCDEILNILGRVWPTFLSRSEHIAHSLVESK